MDALNEDRAGSAVLEHLLHIEENTLRGLGGLGLKETILVTCWFGG
jgi:hypothetical protein